MMEPPDPVYYDSPSDSGIPESLLTWADYMESQERTRPGTPLFWTGSNQPKTQIKLLLLLPLSLMLIRVTSQKISLILCS